jgi:hypothetical protein
MSMQVTTTHKILEGNPVNNPVTGALLIQLHINGIPGQSIVVMSGPLADIRQFVAGEIDEAEIRKRWGMPFGPLI